MERRDAQSVEWMKIWGRRREEGRLGNKQRMPERRWFVTDGNITTKERDGKTHTGNGKIQGHRNQKQDNSTQNSKFTNNAGYGRKENTN